MRICRIIPLSVLFFMVILLTGFSNSTHAGSYSRIKLDPQRVPWIQLSYGIKGFSAEVTAQVQLTSLPAAEVAAALLKTPRGIPIEVGRPESYRISVHKVVDVIFKPPVTEANDVWFNPGNAAALGRIMLRRGKDDFKRIFRFTQDGVFRHRWEPKDQQETSEKPEQWTDVKDTFYAYDMDQLGCPNVTERVVLIYIASAAEISKSTQPLTFCVFGRRQLFHVRLRPDGLQSLEVDYIAKGPQSEIHRQGTVEALKIALDTRPLPSDLDEVEDFSFLGFKENIAIFVDPLSNIPVQISGETSKIGKITIKLRKARLK